MRSAQVVPAGMVEVEPELVLFELAVVFETKRLASSEAAAPGATVLLAETDGRTDVAKVVGRGMLLTALLRPVGMVKICVCVAVTGQIVV